MDLYIKQQLISAGIDVDSALERFMENEALLERFLKKFLNDENYSKLLKALEQDDMEMALTAAHTLKGVCGNLSMDSLFRLLTQQVQAFREGDKDTARKLMPEITKEYNSITEAIRKGIAV